METQKKFKIFVVDDNDIFLKAISHNLQSNLKCEIVPFNSAELCLEHIKEKPDMILSDYLLGDNVLDMNGDKLLVKVKREHPSIPVLMYSSSQGVDIAINMIKLGAIDFIPKEKNGIASIINKSAWIFKSIKIKYFEKRDKKTQRMILSGIGLSILTVLMIYFINIDYVLHYYLGLLITGAILVFLGDIFYRKYNAFIKK